jgi:hypothetical protein
LPECERKKISHSILEKEKKFQIREIEDGVRGYGGGKRRGQQRMHFSVRENSLLLAVSYIY